MATVHLLNVSPGDCTIIQHNSDHVTMMDICDGNLKTVRKDEASLAEAITKVRVRGNFAMCESPTNPLDYLDSIGVKSIFRFILSHPDMDHLDGFNALLDKFPLYNFWDSGVRREPPEFGGAHGYDENDWDRYVKVRDGNEAGVTSVIRTHGAKFAYANEKSKDGEMIDGLYICAPSKELVDAAEDGDDLNNSSYIIDYCSSGGDIVLPGDAHDLTWEFALENYKKIMAPCTFMLAPHHGRDSNRSYTFLDELKPKLTLIGCAPSQHIDYSQWSRRDLDIITSNQAGNVVLQTGDGYIDVYIENRRFAEASECDTSITNAQGYYFYSRIMKA